MKNIIYIRLGFFFYLLLLCFPETWSVPFRTLKVENGLSHNTVHCLMQDQYGFIWAGTSNGLNCYNGNTVKTFRNWNKDSFSTSNNYVTSLLDANDSVIWIGTDQGIYLYKREQGQFEPLTLKTRYGVSISSKITKMIKNKDGKIWIGTLGQGLFCYDGKMLRQFISYTSFVNDFIIDNNNNFYVTTLSNEILVFNKQGLFTKKIIIPQIAFCLYYTDQKIWIGMEKGIIGYLQENSTQLVCYNITEEKTNITRCITKDNEGNLLLGTDYGLYQLDKSNKIKCLHDNNEFNGMQNAQITSMIKDHEGGIWIGTNNNGINYMSRNTLQFHYYYYENEEQGMRESPITIGSICEANNNTLYIGTNIGIFTLTKGATSIHNFLPDALSKDIGDVRSLWLDNQTLWAGTYGNGIIKIDLINKSIKRYQYEKGKPNALPSNYVFKLYRTREGKLYVGLNKGLYWLDETTDRFYPITIIGATLSVTDIAEDINRNLWIATATGGLYRCDQATNAWQRYQHNPQQPESLFDNNLTLLKEDYSGHLWIGSNGGGIGFFNPGNKCFERFDSDDKLLANKVIYAIEQDQNGFFWIATNNGLFKANIKEKEKTFQLFTSSNGLQANQFNLHASLLLHNGDLAFGNMNGLVIFSPSALKRNDTQPLVYITGITFPQNDTKPKKDSINWNNVLQLPEKITLPYKHNSFTLTFSALSFENPTENAYRYQMMGIDKEWIYSSSKNEAAYAHLSPGTYLFQVEGANCDGTWNKEATTITIVITPPWWATIWAIIGYILLCLSIIVIIGWIWNKRIKKKYSRRMQEYNMAKDKEIYHQKINFFVNLVHEIRTPLSLIELPLEQLKAVTSSQKEQQDLIYTIEKNVNYLLNITKQLMDFEKIERGGMHMEKQTCDIVALTKEILEQFYLSAQLKQIQLLVDLPDHPIYALVDQDKISQIMVNILSNAFKYTHTTIELKLTYNQQTLHWYVDDDGEGIPQNKKEKIFEAFYRIHESETYPSGTGIGLTYAKLLTEKHGGSLTVETNQWNGARFILTLPIAAADITKQNPPNELVNAIHSPVDPEAMTKNKNLTILLVEDNEDLLQMTSKILNKWYHVKKASNGQQALDIIESEMVDIIVSDVMMPIINGFELCKRIKQDINTSHIPFILLTAKITIDAKQEGLLSGADAYVEKPFSILQLRMQIENLLHLRQQFYKQMQTLENHFSINLNAQNDAGISQKDQEFILRLQELISNKLSDEKFSLDSVAEEMNMSRSSLYRKIKALSGIAPTEYLKVLRLNKAAELIRQGNRVNEVYQQVGFSSASYFAKCFKAQFNVLPKDFK